MSDDIDNILRRAAKRILELLGSSGTDRDDDSDDPDEDRDRDDGDGGDDEDDEDDGDSEPDPDSDVTITAVNGVHSQDSTSSSFWFNIDQIRPLGDAADDVETLEFGDAEMAQSYRQASGVELETDGNVLGFVCRLSSRVDAATRAWVEQDGERLAEADLSDHEGGDTFEFDSTLEAGTYRLLVDGGGSEEFDRARGETDYPVDNRREPEAIELPEDGEGQSGHSNYCGMAIVPDQDLKGLEVRLGGTREDGAKDITALHVFDDEQDQLATQLTTGNDAGDWIGIDYDFNAGQEYRVLANGEGEDYVRYRADAECPYTGDALDVVAGSYSPGDESQSESYVYNADRIRGSLREVAEPEPEYRDIEGSQIAQSSNARLAGNPVRGEREVAEVLCQEGPPEDYDVDARIDCEEMFGFEPNIAHMRWQVFFPSDFEVHQNMDHGGIKLSGLADHRGSGGAGGNHDPGNAYSLRMYATSRGPPNDYTDGDDIPVGIQVYDISAYEADKEYGHMHPWTVGITKGEWTDLDLFMSLDTNRVLGWVNERSAFDSEDHGGYEFLSSSNSDRGIHEWRDHYYFGGPWGSPKEQSIYHRRTAGWTGDNCPEL